MHTNQNKIFLSNQEKIFSVSEFLDFLNEILTPCHAIVQGEIGEKINNYPGYSFFNLLDKTGSILKCFTFRNVINALGVKLEPGMEIRVIGYPQIRKNRGEFNFQIERIELVGEGILKKQYEILKKKLEVEGYFDTRFKKPIPKFSRNIGLITSKYGRGAKKDFLTHLGNFGFDVKFYDVRVEGPLAVYDIVEAISWFNQNLPEIDVLVLTRGGGSWESLQPFNSEEVVKAIFSSKVPIICAVGHENDETLADFASDLRASTPTDAAKILTEDWKTAVIRLKEWEKNLPSSCQKLLINVKERIFFSAGNITSSFNDKISMQKRTIENLAQRLNYFFKDYFENFKILQRMFQGNSDKIKNILQDQKSKVEQITQDLIQNKTRWQAKVKRLISEEEKKLNLSSPNLKLKQGYTITSDEFGKIIKNPEDLNIDQTIKTKFYQGSVSSKVKKISHH